MTTSRNIIHYAPGSNRVSASATSVTSPVFDHTLAAAIGLDDRLVIQQRLLRHFLEEDGRSGSTLPTEIITAETSVLARLQAATLGRPFFRPSLRLTRLS